MNDILLIMIGLIIVGVILFVLFGQKKYNEYMKP